MNDRNSQRVLSRIGALELTPQQAEELTNSRFTFTTVSYAAMSHDDCSGDCPVL